MNGDKPAAKPVMGNKTARADCAYTVPTCPACGEVTYSRPKCPFCGQHFMRMAKTKEGSEAP